tara:strand:+ start:81 stop:329 length:249 start_codon:yes stop_codon:yes gene_type:complete
MPRLDDFIWTNEMLCPTPYKVFERTGKVKIDEFELTFVQNHILWLYVSMSNTAVVKPVYRSDYLTKSGIDLVKIDALFRILE